MTTRYKILFSVELENEYYRNLQCSDFSVVAAGDTAQLLKNRQMIYKIVGNMLVVLIKVKTDGPDKNKPFIDISRDDRFLFYLTLNNPQFVTVTNMDDDLLKENKFFYFTNLTQNDLGTRLSLTQKILVPVGAVNYKPGDMAADAGGDIYECIKSTTSATPPPNATFWHKRSTNQYATARDMLLFATRIRNYTTTANATLFKIRVWGLDKATNLYTREIFLTKNTVTSDTPTSKMQADLSELPPGRYRIQVNADEYDLYIDDEAVYNNAFGVIDIYSHFPDGPGFGFFDLTGKVKDTVYGITGQWLRYKIRFANRMAYWKYFTTRHGVSVINGAPDYVFDPTPAGPGPKDFFISNRPIPLTEAPLAFKFTVPAIVFDEPPLVPNPDPAISGMLSRTVPDKDYYCTINLNY